MEINMIPFDLAHPRVDGKYLVKTETTFKRTPMFLQASCTQVYNTKKQRFETSVDVANQVVILISDKPII